MYIFLESLAITGINTMSPTTIVKKEVNKSVPSKTREITKNATPNATDKP